MQNTGFYNLWANRDWYGWVADIGRPKVHVWRPAKPRPAAKRKMTLREPAGDEKP